MIAPPIPDDDADRVASLRRLGLLDTQPEERFDRITRLAQKLFAVPTALVSLVDADRQWFKSRQGLPPPNETSREISFCGHAILGPDVLEVEDAAADARFADNPLVVDEPNIRFYAGCPISGPDGAVIGTLCLIDKQPRSLDEEDLESLRDLAGMVEHEIAVTQLAVDDELTGLANRRGFMVMANQALAFCQRQDADALVVYADVNGLKAVNDEYGHKVGDRLIQLAGSAMAVAFRRSDVVARLGGDEFAAFLAYYRGGEEQAAQRLAEAVQACNSELEGLPFTVSMAVGSARSDHRNPQSLEALLEQADASMYADKLRRRSGR